MLTRWNDWNDLWAPEFPREFDRTVRALEELRHDMDRLFRGQDRWFGDLATAFGDHAGPEVSLSDSGKDLTVRAELPGLSEKDIDVTVNAQTLTLRGERGAEPPEGYSVHRKERHNYRFERSYQLPTKIDPEKVQATLKNGVLTLTLPKAAEAQPKQISIKAG